VTPTDAVAFSKAGVNVFTFCLPLGWIGEDKYDYREVDQILSYLLKAAPNAFCVPRVQVEAPAWWMDKHPDQSVRFANGVNWQPNGWGGTKHESFASELWRREGGEAFRRLIRHIVDSPYGSRVLGIHVTNGIYGEWHAWSATDIPDTSEPMRQAFVRWLANKYGGEVSRLRQAWNTPTLTFDAVSPPTLNERRNGNVGMFRDPKRSRKVMDYYECFHQVTVNAIDHFCRIVKKESDGKMLTCVFYSYSPDINWPQEGDHRAAPMAHRLKSVDIFASPHSYERRALGQDGIFRNCPASIALHGKLFMDEADDRTYLANDPSFTHVKNVEESVSVLRRAFANAVTHGVGLWYMDQQEKWFHDAKIMNEIARMKHWADVSMGLSRRSVAQVAVISALQSEFYVCGRETGKNNVTYPLYSGQIGELCRSGAPFDWYMIEDLAEGLVPPHKVYIFLDCFYLTPHQRQAIEKLKTDARTLVWFYAPGYVASDALSLKEMSALAGMEFEQVEKGRLQVKVEPGVCPNAPNTFGPTGEQSPIFASIDGGCKVWGRFADTGKAGLVLKDCGAWRSVYCGSPLLPASVLRTIFSQTGVHIYCDSGDNTSANAGWVSLHAASAGRKKVRLPQPSPVYDVFNAKSLGAKVEEFEVEMNAGQTALFMLSAPPAN
jgi:hypothetical protein